MWQYYNSSSGDFVTLKKCDNITEVVLMILSHLIKCDNITIVVKMFLTHLTKCGKITNVVLMFSPHLIVTILKQWFGHTQ